MVSGLTVGYLSIDDLVLELKSNTGTETEKYYSNRVLPILENRHWLLCTLLLCNASAMEALPIFLSNILV
jgi:metal transporter CNNM